MKWSVIVKFQINVYNKKFHLASVVPTEPQLGNQSQSLMGQIGLLCDPTATPETETGRKIVTGMELLLKEP